MVGAIPSTMETVLDIGVPCGSVEGAASESRLDRAQRWACSKNFSEAALSQFLKQLKDQAGDIVKQAAGEGAIEFLVSLHPVGRAAVIAKELGEAVYGVIESTLNIRDAQKQVQKARTVVELQRASANLALANINNGASLLLSIASLRSSIRDLKTPSPGKPDVDGRRGPRRLRRENVSDGWRRVLSDRDIDFLESTRNIDSGDISVPKARREFEIASRGPRSKKTDFLFEGEKFSEEIELPNTHHWRGKPDATFCRFSSRKCFLTAREEFEEGGGKIKKISPIEPRESTITAAPKDQHVPPEGFEDIFDEPGMSKTGTPGGRAENPKTFSGKFADKYAEHLQRNPEILADLAQRTGGTKIFNKKLPEGLVPEHSIPHPHYPPGMKPRIDRLWRRGETIFEIKPNTRSAERGVVQAKQYAEWMDKYEPLDGGRKWKSVVVEYDQALLMRYLEEIGMLHGKTKATSKS